jgi:hypothetical protein
MLAAFDEQIRRHPKAGREKVVEGNVHVMRVVASGEEWSRVP